MRNLFLLLFLFALPFQVHAQWKQHPLNYNYTRHPDFFIPVALHFSDTANGFILNDAAMLQYSNHSWHAVNPNTEDPFTYTNIFTLNPYNTYLCSYDGKIARYNGDSLQVLYTDPGSETAGPPVLNTIFMTDSAEGWAAGNNGALIKIDGDNFEKDSISNTYHFKDIYFDRHDHGWMIGYQETNFGNVGVVCEYKDHHWLVNTFLDEMLYDIEFSSPDSGFIAGEQGIYRYNKDVNEWETENIPDYYRQLHLSLLNDGYGISVSDNSRNLVYQNGVWSDGPVAEVSDLLSVQTTGIGKAWAISQIGNNNPENFNEGKIQLMNDNGWTSYPSADLDSTSVQPVEYAITNITALNRKQVWLNGQYLHLPENADWYDTIPTLANDNFTNASKMFSDSFGLGINGDLQEWNGVSWINKHLDVPNPDTSFVNLTMQVFDDTSAFICRQYLVWATGEIRSSVAKYDYPTNSLYDNTLLDTRAIFGIHFSDKTHGWCVGDSGLLARYTADHWSMLPPVSDKRLSGVFSVDSLNAWAVGNGGTLLHFQNDEWIQESLPTEQNLFSVFFTDSTHGWIAGDSGLVYHYDGSNWQRDTTIATTQTLYTVYMIDSTYGFVGGDNGTLLHYIQKNDTIIINPPPPAMICENGNTYFVYSPGGTEYAFQWQIDTGNGFENLVEDAIYSGVLTDTLRIAVLPDSFYGYRFRCIASKNGIDSVGETQEIIFKNKWLGTIDSSWENAANWSCGAVPGPNTNVEIQEGTIVISTMVAIRSLALSPGVAVTISESGGLTILK